MKRVALILLGCFAFFAASSQTIITTLYVDSSVVISGNGGTWATAYKSLAAALDTAWQHPELEKIYVAKGTYYPMSFPYEMDYTKRGTQVSTADNKYKTFHIRTGLEVYGGYPSGGGVVASSNDFSTLSGNVYHRVVIDSSAYWSKMNDTTIISNFKISGVQAQTNLNLVSSIQYNNHSSYNAVILKYGGLSLDSIYYSGAVETYDGIIKITNTKISYNNCIGLLSGNSRCIIENSDFSYNHGTLGSAIRAYNSRFSLKYCSFIGNDSLSGNIYSSDNKGACLYGEKIIATIDNCTFYNNRATNNPCFDLSLYSYLEMTNSYVGQNKTHWSFGSTLKTEDGVIKNCKFEYNTSDRGCVGVKTIDHCLFYSNIGVMYGAQNILNNLFINNVNKDAAILELRGDNWSINKIYNNTFYGNGSDASFSFASDTMGPIFISSGVCDFQNNIFCKNIKKGSVLLNGSDFTRQSNVSINQCTFKNNLLQLPSNFYTLDEGKYGLGSSAQNNTFNISPLFLDSINFKGADLIWLTNDDGLTLQSASPCIDAGYPNASLTSILTTDIKSAPRAQGAQIDLGAYEYGCGTIDTISASICEGSAYYFNNIACITSGVYYDTLQGSSLCDSFIVLNLIVIPLFNNLNKIACKEYFFNGQILTQSGYYYDTLINSLGCDSIVTLNLTIKSSSSYSYAQTACNSYLFNSQTLTQSGTYYDTLTNAMGCDSTILLSLNITTLQSTISQQNQTLIANDHTAETYTWRNCTTGEIMAQNTQWFTPKENGLYAVELGKNGCYVQSECISLRGTRDRDRLQVWVTPNPTQGELTVTANYSFQDAEVTVFDMLGKRLFNMQGINKNVFRLNLSTLSNGLYFVEIMDRYEKYRTKVWKQ